MKLLGFAAKKAYFSHSNPCKTMTTPEVDSLQRRAAEAIATLRRDELANGLPFMLGNAGLPAGQFFFEYPDGRIAVARYPRTHAAHQVVRWLTEEESARMRLELGVPIQVPAFQ